MAKEAFKNFVEILLYSPIPKKLAIPLGVTSVLGMMFSPKLKGEKELNQLSWATTIMSLVCFSGLAVTGLTSRFNVLPKPVVGAALLVVGGVGAILYPTLMYKESTYNKQSTRKEYDAIEYGTNILSILGAAYLAREGAKALLSR